MKSVTRRVGLTMMVMALMGTGQVRAGLIHSAAADFSPTSNPNGVWTYGSSTTLGSAFILGTPNGNVSGIDYWVNQWNVAGPSITHNGTNSAVNFSGVTWDPGQLGFHPGPGGENAVVRFTAPVSGLYLLDSAFTGLDRSPTTTDVHVLLNGASIFDGLVNAFGPGSGPTFSAPLTLSANDTVDFSVGFGQNGNWISDTTGLSATFTSVPEPSSLVLAAFGIGLCCWRRLRRAH